jgi:hypothetical protein
VVIAVDGGVYDNYSNYKCAAAAAADAGADAAGR